MVVDDHVIDSLRRYFENAYQELKKEWESNEYEQLANCPSFKVAAAYYDAMIILINGSDRLAAIEGQLRRILDEELEVENFWKEKR